MIGQGKYGQVFVGQLNSKKVAIKKMNIPQDVSFEKFKENFIQEATV